ncbi:MAG: chorismate mutase [Anaerolineales bacterium]
MTIRGVRGAAVAGDDCPESILGATRDLLISIREKNPSLKIEDIASILFTLSEDLQSAYPAEAARALGWLDVPMICAREIPVPGSLPRCIRVLLHWNTDLPQQEIHHVYHGEAALLRPDWLSL